MGATKYHISKNGQANPCPAEIQCTLTDISGEGKAKHFESKQEAQAYAEKTMSEKHDVTKSAGKKSQTFNIPDKSITVTDNGDTTITTGGNYARLESEGKDVHDNKVVAEEIKNDIKKATQTGFLPSEVGGKKVKYSVKTGGYGAVFVKADYDENALDQEIHMDDSGKLTLRSKHHEQVKDMEEKLENMHSSYRRDSDNEKKNEHLTNVNSTSSVRNNTEYAKVKAAEKKAVRDVAKEAEKYIEPKDRNLPFLSESRKDEIIEKALAGNKTVSKNYNEWADKVNQYNLADHIERENNLMSERAAKLSDAGIYDDRVIEKEKARNKKWANELLEESRESYDRWSEHNKETNNINEKRFFTPEHVRTQEMKRMSEIKAEDFKDDVFSRLGIL